jgi:hypothetical protein
VTRRSCADATLLFGRRRLFTAIVAGCVAGVLGLTNALGLLSYLLAMLLVRASRHTRGAAKRAAPAAGTPLSSSLPTHDWCTPRRVTAAPDRGCSGPLPPRQRDHLLCELVRLLGPPHSTFLLTPSLLA